MGQRLFHVLVRHKQENVFCSIFGTEGVTDLRHSLQSFVLCSQTNHRCIAERQSKYFRCPKATLLALLRHHLGR